MQEVDLDGSMATSADGSARVTNVVDFGKSIGCLRVSASMHVCNVPGWQSMLCDCHWYVYIMYVRCVVGVHGSPQCWMPTQRPAIASN